MIEKNIKKKEYGKLQELETRKERHSYNDKVKRGLFIKTRAILISDRAEKRGNIS